jgi:hypothetical protein
MNGISMATPNVAGSAALIRRYFSDGFHWRFIAPTATFLKAMLIHCSDPLIVGQKYPDNAYGFGQLNLGRYLPFLGSSASILVTESVRIGQLQHRVSSFRISGSQHPLRVTISSLDAVNSADSLIPLLADLDLIVVCPSGRILRGNHDAGESEEHFSTTERVILDPNEVEIGTYEIHVISMLSDLIKDCQFSVVVSGLIQNPAMYLRFTPATKCLPCGSGICDQNSYRCQCSWSIFWGTLANLSFTPLKLLSFRHRKASLSHHSNHCI